MKTKLVEINYSFENCGEIDAFIVKRAKSAKLLLHLSEYFEVHSIGFSGFCFNGWLKGANYSIFQKKIGHFTIPFSLHHFIKKQSPHVVLVHGINNFFQTIHLRICLGRKIKLLVQHHGERPNGFVKKTLLLLCSFFVDGYLFAGAGAALDLGLNKEKVYELMEGSAELIRADKNECRRQLDIPPDEIIYLWVARLVEIKNPLFFLNVFNTFSDKSDRIKLYLIYNDSKLLKKCETICEGNPNIIFVGSVVHAKMPDWYGAADFFVSASHHEASGYAVCEAMGCNLVPILPKIDSFNFMTEEGYCSIMYENNNSVALLAALNKSLTIDQLIMKLKVEAIFKQRLSYDAIAQNFQRIVKSL
jgi:glycosyltransferase involved in cell wall biosynthesis